MAVGCLLEYHVLHFPVDAVDLISLFASSAYDVRLLVEVDIVWPDWALEVYLLLYQVTESWHCSYQLESLLGEVYLFLYVVRAVAVFLHELCFSQ